MSANLIDVSLGAAKRTDLEQGEDFGAALANCALTWHRQPGESAALQAIASDTPILLRGADAAAVVTVSTGGKLKITAAHGPVEMLQAALPRTLQPPIWTTADPQPIRPSGRWPPSATTLAISIAVAAAAANQAFAQLLKASENDNELRRAAENLCCTGELLTTEIINRRETRAAPLLVLGLVAA